MNLPPLFDDAAVASRMWREIGAIEQDGGLPLLLRYQEAGGSMADRAAGAIQPGFFLAPSPQNLTFSTDYTRFLLISGLAQLALARGQST